MKKLSRGVYLGKNTFEHDLNGIILTTNEYEEGLCSSWHYHENTYFAMIQKGGSIERRKNETIECRPGMLLFYNFEEPHCNENYKHRSRNFSVEVEDKWYKRFDIDKRKLPGCFVVEDAIVKSLFTNIFKETIINDPYSSLGIEGLLLQIFAQVLREKPSKQTPPWVERIRQLIFYEEPHNLNLDYLSKQLQMHPVSLSKEFAQYFHCSFSQYTRIVKCQRALQLLSKKHLSINDVALESGFTDASHLSKVFRSLYNMTPSVYRKAI
ncbi:MAG TPA: AraC family transcriptional regulator [Chitinophagaceae bacterium]|jgi:AraC-like DNA-binding protein|nr:AraC family transcriptional regulator [Chitinophagaceae bacterium]